MIPHFIFLDLETTGLEAGTDEITEAAWIGDDGIEEQHFVEHTRLPNPWVIHHTDYVQRILPAQKIEKASLRFYLNYACSRVRNGKGKGEVYLVGACPAFDDRFLRVLYGAEPLPYNYHVVDVEAMAMGALGHDAPCRLEELRAALGIEDENPAAHTALADAREVKLIWDALKAKRQSAV